MGMAVAPGLVPEGRHKTWRRSNSQSVRHHFESLFWHSKFQRSHFQFAYFLAPRQDCDRLSSRVLQLTDRKRTIGPLSHGVFALAEWIGRQRRQDFCCYRGYWSSMCKAPEFLAVHWLWMWQSPHVDWLPMRIFVWRRLTMSCRMELSRADAAQPC